MQRQTDFSDIIANEVNEPQRRKSKWIYSQLRVPWQHRIMESTVDFKTFRKALHGSSFFPRLLYSSLMPSSKQSGNL